MSMATVHSRAQAGIEALPVTVEAHVGGGLPGFSLVGLPEAAVRESRDRVRAALANCGFDFPQSKVIVNLAPADLPKEGGRFDLPIALGVLGASGQLRRESLDGVEFIGELSLAGEIRPVLASLCAALAAARCGRRLVVPESCGGEAALVGAGEVRVARHLLAVVGWLGGLGELARAVPTPAPAAALPEPDLADVRGQGRGRRALEIAAAGGHNLLFVGPPGTGKTLLARRLPGLLPPLAQPEAMEVAVIASAAGRPFRPGDFGVRPFRAPHHTASAVALTGGGANPRPGEVTLAHHGVLFLDELPEFDRRALESLRQPLEEGSLTISRAATQRTFPARFMLVAAMNPCPCGHLGDPLGRCRCSADVVERYRSRISGPLLDRIDLVVDMPRPPPEVLSGPAGEPSLAVAVRVAAARARQNARQRVENARISRPDRLLTVLPADARRLLERAAQRYGLSLRAVHRALKVSRTIADLKDDETLTAVHLREALSYRLPPTIGAPGICSGAGRVSDRL